jgi:hypothetical protein
MVARSDHKVDAGSKGLFVANLPSQENPAETHVGAYV